MYFQVDLSSASSGTVTLQEKTSGSTAFSDIQSTTYRSEWGSSNTVILGSVDSSQGIEEGGSHTFSIDGNERTIKVNSVDTGSDTIDFDIDGINEGTHDSGYVRDIESSKLQVDEVRTGLSQDQSNQIADGQWWNFTTGGTQHNVFLDSVIDSTTIAADIDGNFDNYNEGEQLDIGNGYVLEVTEVIDLSSDSGEVKFTVYQEVGEGVFKVYNPVSVSSDDYWQYRAKLNGEYSDSIYFSVGKGHNIPYVDYTQINGDRIYDFNTTQDRTTDSDVYANVKDDETDTYNVTLYDASDDSKVAEIQTGSDFKTMFAYAISEFFSFGDLSREDHFFTTSLDSFMSQDSTSYSYYFGVEDLNDGGTRLTPVYQFNTGTSQNQAPNITAVEAYDGSSWRALDNFTEYGDFVNKIRVKVDDPDNDFHDGYLRIENEYDSKVLVGGNSSNPANGSSWDYLDNNYNLVWNMSRSEYNFSRVLDSGNFTADVYVTDYNQNNSKSDKWSVSWGTYQINSYSVCGQSSGKVEMNESSTCYMNVTGECVGGECNSQTDGNSSTDQAENTTVTADPQPVKTAVDSSKNLSIEQNLLSLEYWRSCIKEVVQ